MIARLCVLAFAVNAVVVLVGLQLDISSRQQELAQLRQEIEIQRIENKEVERLLTLGDDDDYIERIAREKLGFVYPDERIFIDMSGS